MEEGEMNHLIRCRSHAPIESSSTISKIVFVAF